MSAAKNLKRIYLNDLLQAGQSLQLFEYHHNYLINVMRMRSGFVFLAFNERDGEFEVRIAEVQKKALSILIERKTRDVPKQNYQLTLYFCPVKNPAPSYIVQKAVELGATEIVAVISDRTIVRDVNVEKLNQAAIEAVEQCERFAPPAIKSMKLTQIPENLRSSLLFCSERALSATHIVNHNVAEDAAVLIGPEGGFTDEESALIKSWKYTKEITLGRNILRADTAIFMALSILYSKISCGS